MKSTCLTLIWRSILKISRFLVDATNRWCWRCSWEKISVYFSDWNRIKAVDIFLNETNGNNECRRNDYKQSYIEGDLRDSNNPKLHSFLWQRAQVYKRRKRLCPLPMLPPSDNICKKHRLIVWSNCWWIVVEFDDFQCCLEIVFSAIWLIDFSIKFPVQ